MQSLPLPLLVLLLMGVFEGRLSSLWGQSQLVTGIEAIIPNQVYVVHSQMNNASTLVATSNIYVIKGTADTVWIFGSGYGDHSHGVNDQSDLNMYKGQTFEPAYDAVVDAGSVDMIIQQDFQVIPSNAVLQFIVPHFHLDHINKEFVAAFFEDLSYPDNGSRIWVHINDYWGATCNTYMCGSTQPVYHGAPYNDPWTPAYLSMFRTLGNTSDPCNTDLIAFSSPTGDWTIRKGLPIAQNGHTDGSVNLDNDNYKYRVQGADGGNQCVMGSDWEKFPIHGNVNIPSGTEDVTAVNSMKVIPNPADKVFSIQVAETVNEATLLVLDISGRIISKTTFSGSGMTFDCSELPPGIYQVQLISLGSIQNSKLSITH